MIFLFFKQKTAYEMRISDWSSDVCSSDLIPRCAAEQYPRLVLGENDLTVFERSLPWDHAAGAIFLNEAGGKLCRKDGSPYVVGDDRRGLLGAVSPQLWDEAARILFGRSEEHTSELQSLMRIPYASL